MSDDTDRPAHEPSEDADAPRVNPHAQTVRTLSDAMLRTAALPVGGTVLIAAAIGFAVAGVPGIAAAVTAGVVTTGASLFTMGLMRVTAPMAPSMAMGAVLGGFFVKMFVLLLTMSALSGVDAVHSGTLAATFGVMVLVWAAAQLVAFRRTRTPTVIPDS
ncbi:hypothetical protein [Saccharopolyspora sp. CA-218241]|uniref:hypothetical protein n=1 Tax=Saccharopolyspora sp. CA-218241 TaxID=3240027 RepID=UPI003D965966